MITIIKYKRELVIGSNYVYIGRKFGPFKEDSKWHNPYIIGKDGTRQEVVDKYKTYLLARQDLINALLELKDKILICWCYPLLCHGEILKELAEK